MFNLHMPMPRHVVDRLQESKVLLSLLLLVKFEIIKARLRIEYSLLMNTELFFTQESAQHLYAAGLLY